MYKKGKLSPARAGRKGTNLSDDWAAELNTISWEILCGFKHRLPRVWWVSEQSSEERKLHTNNLKSLAPALLFQEFISVISSCLNPLKDKGQVPLPLLSDLQMRSRVT